VDALQDVQPAITVVHKPSLVLALTINGIHEVALMAKGLGRA
jgi:hypothetical protein